MKFSSFRISLLLSFLVFSSFLQKNPRLQFQHINDGLTNGQVECVIQDSHGFIWIGTNGGLNKFDGSAFNFYINSDSSTSLSGGSITTMYEDRYQSLWIGTENGICRYNREQDHFKRFNTLAYSSDDPKIFPVKIRGIIEDENGLLWVAGEEKGLFFFDREQSLFRSFPYGNQMGQIHTKRITQLELDGQGNLWAGTIDQGFYIIDVNTLSARNIKTLKNGADSSSIVISWALERDVNGAMWIGTKGTGLFRIMVLENGEITYKQYIHQEDDPNSLMNNEIYAILLDSRGQLWVGNENGGLHIYDREDDNFIRYEAIKADESSISQNSIRSIYEDHQNRIWIGTAFQGVDVYDPNHTKFDHYYQSETDENGLNNNIIRDFYEDDVGNVWIATDGGGLNFWDRSTDNFDHYVHDPNDPNSLQSNAVLGIVQGADSNLWITGWSGGINVMFDDNPAKFKHYRAKGLRNSLPINHFFDIIKDTNDNIWAANFGNGLSKFDWESKEFVMYYEGDRGLDTYLITVLLEDSRGNIWLGTEDSGAIKFDVQNEDHAKFVKIGAPGDVKGELQGQVINHIMEDHDRNIWLATNIGLSVIDVNTEQITTYSTEMGLPHSSIQSIVEDENGLIWVATNAGLSRFNPNTLEVTNYDDSDGLQSGIFSRYAATKLSTGELVFGGNNGFNIFHPDSIHENTYIPEIYITSFKIFNKPVVAGIKNSPLSKHISSTERITLTHEQSVFSFEYTALNFTRNEMNKFAFRLEGLEKNWNYVGNEKKASYSNLDPGDYIFRVKASNNDGVWNEEGLALYITILPAWWDTWWAYLIYALIISFLLYRILRMRTSYLQDQREVLSELVAKRTEELKTKNDRIKFQAEELRLFNNSLNSMNENLEQTVKDRTQELIEKNKKLAEYAFINAHNLRVPVANIKGIIQLFENENTIEEILELIEMLKGQSEKLDDVLMDIKYMLEKE